MKKTQNTKQKEILKKSVALSKNIKDNINKTKQENLKIQKKIEDMNLRVSNLQNKKKFNFFSKIEEKMKNTILPNIKNEDNKEQERNIFEKKFEKTKQEITKNLENKSNEINQKIKNTHNNFIIQSKQEQENHCKNLYKSLDISLKKNIKEDFKKEFSNLKIENKKEFENVKNILNQKQKEFAFYIQNYIDALENKKNEFEEKSLLKKIKEKIEKNIIETKNKVDAHTQNLEEKTKKIEDKIEEIFEEKTKSNVKKLDSAMKSEIKKVKEEFTILQKEQLAKEILKFNKEFELLSTINRDEMLGLKESIGDLSLKTKDEFSEAFETEIEKFNEKLKEKQNEFLTKLMHFENDKKKSIEEFEEYKLELKNLTKNYTDKAHNKVEEIKTQKKILEEEEKKSLKLLEDYTILQKEEIEKTIKNFEKDKIFEDNNFKTNHLNKIQNLQNFTSKKIEDVEKKFVEKNLKKVKEKIILEINTVNLIKEDIEIKLENQKKEITQARAELEKNLDVLNLGKKNIEEKTEKRLFELEKQFNKRFLEYDTSFSNLKKVIIEEMEGTIKDMQVAVEEKISKIDKFTSKIYFESNEIIKNFEDSHQIQKKVDNLEKKFAIIEPTFEKLDLNKYVHLMADYETRIHTIINSLKEKNLSDKKIEEILISKGHPKFYLRIILNSYNNI